MKFLSVLALAVSCASAQRKCGTTNNNAPQNLRYEATAEPADSLAARQASRARYTVDTYVHVITTQNKSSLYPREMVEQQVWNVSSVPSVGLQLIVAADASDE